jgi:lipopolysaccharide biosynthesis glycosyltransferase
VLVFAIDDNYCWPLLVALQSLSVTNPALSRTAAVYVLHAGLRDRSVQAIESHARRLGLDVSVLAVTMPDLPYNVSKGGAVANYLRLAIGEVLPDVARAVYVDADVLIRKDISGLVDVDLGGRTFGAVRDQIAPTCANASWTDWWTEQGVDRSRDYFNSGVLVLDLEACAATGLFERAFEYVRAFPDRMRLWDQDALNLAADDQWHRLERRWNTFPMSALVRTPWVRYAAEDVTPLSRLVEGEQDACIFHYVSPAKPWKGLLPSGEARNAYEEVSRQVGDPEELGVAPDTKKKRTSEHA